MTTQVELHALFLKQKNRKRFSGHFETLDLCFSQSIPISKLGDVD